jgi:Tol biopolymer transport system component
MYDVWVSTRQDTIWGPAVNVGPNVNSPASEFTARVSFDGRELYVASKRDGGFGDYDIWVCLWDSITGEWGPAANLGPRINSFSREYCASPSIDGKTLYFAGWGAGLGYVDIYVSQWQDTAWGQPVNLGSPVNTATWDNGPSISSDGLKLYFASSRDTMDPADQDIWVSEWRGPGVDEGLKKDSVRPHGYELLEGAPNPFSFGTIIVFAVPEDCWMELSIHNTCGSRVAMLANGSYSTGYHSLLWNALTAEGNLLPSGVYFCCLNARGCSLSRKLIIVR